MLSKASLLSLGGLLLSFQPSTEVVITVISHMHRHSIYSYRADCCRRGIPTVFVLLIRPLE